jgi:diguanylate cyclase (GGDEF)-like protein
MSNRQPDYLEPQSAWKAFRLGVLYDYPTAAAICWVGMFVLGSASLGWAAMQWLAMSRWDQAQVALLTVGAALAGNYSVRARNPPTLFIGGDLFVYAALFLHGAAAAIIVATAEILAPSRRSGYRFSARLITPFHTAVSFAVGGAAYELAKPHFATLPDTVALAALLSMSGATAIALGLLTDELLRKLKRKQAFAPLRAIIDGYQGFFLPLACSVIVALLSLMPSVTAFLVGCASTVAFVLFALRRWSVGQVVADESNELPSVDAITGVELRKAFLRDVEQAERTAEAGGSYGYAVVCIGCDMSSVNRNLGYAAGEEHLGVVARRLRNEVRGADAIGRTEVGTFSVLLRVVANPSESKAIAQRLLEVVNKPVELNGMRVQGGANVGVASSWALFDDGDSVFEAAERSLRGARALGVGHVIVFDDQPGRSSEEPQASLPFSAPSPGVDRRARDRARDRRLH